VRITFGLSKDSVPLFTLLGAFVSLRLWLTRRFAERLVTHLESVKRRNCPLALRGRGGGSVSLGPLHQVDDPSTSF
jgi:hypothetical protein